jgi:hypothetical protein
MSDAIEVKPGQLWIDNDKRNPHTRYVRVVEIVEDRAVVMTWYDKPGSVARGGTIRLDRFRPIATGYRLAEDQDGAA